MNSDEFGLQMLLGKDGEMLVYDLAWEGVAVKVADAAFFSFDLFEELFFFYVGVFSMAFGSPFSFFLLQSVVYIYGRRGEERVELVGWGISI